MMATKYCDSYPEIPCCDSCHEDNDEGYEELEGYPEHYVCCKVMNHIKKEKDNGRTESPEE